MYMLSFFRIVSNFGCLKTHTFTLILLMPAGLPWCFYNPHTLTWTTGSLMYTCALFACVYTQTTWVYCLIQKSSIGSAQNLTAEKSRGGSKAQHTTVTHPWGGPYSTVLSLDFESKHPCSMPSTLLADSNRLSCALIFGHKIPQVRFYVTVVLAPGQQQQCCTASKRGFFMQPQLSQTSNKYILNCVVCKPQTVLQTSLQHYLYR